MPFYITSFITVIGQLTKENLKYSALISGTANISRILLIASAKYKESMLSVRGIVAILRNALRLGTDPPSLNSAVIRP